MRKFLFFLILLPALAALGHDGYMFYQYPEKGLQLSDLGALWDKYHKETHDQWKTKVKEFSQSVDELIPETPAPKDIIPKELIPEAMVSGEPAEALETTDETDTPPAVSVEEIGAKEVANFSEGFEQSIERDGTTNVKTLGPDDYKKEDMDKNSSKLIAIIGFLLEQKAVFVLGVLPLFIFVLHLLFSALFKEKEEMDKIRALKKKKRKGGGYTYSRK